MTTVRIPDWNRAGVLPPFIPSRPVSQDRSPYRVTLSDLIEHFGTTPARRKILAGFLGYRAALHEMGFVDGFQWLNGSFTERVEQSRLRRPPRDLDVVTFVRRPPAFKPAEHHRYLFDTDAVRARFLTDSYYVALDTQSQEELVTQSALIGTACGLTAVGICSGKVSCRLILGQGWMR